MTASGQKQTFPLPTYHEQPQGFPTFNGPMNKIRQIVHTSQLLRVETVAALDREGAP